MVVDAPADIVAVGVAVAVVAEAVGMASSEELNSDIKI